MATDAVLQVRIDSGLKQEAEELYSRLGISIADAVRMFVVQSIEVQGLPFEVKTGFPSRRTLHAYGIAKEYTDESKVSEEKRAWADAVKRKHEDSGR
ncbi:MAG TPA: type II toxin-antitoxin system antitoxin, RelB/DinJ family [Sphaerochaeta sp.]|jgi:addiction module RelB/DinJ family antitoxin|nr:type II toxin-antitoxin system antitoxin, RelB/DinJ family [Sphaerochaeta sp.]